MLCTRLYLQLLYVLWSIYLITGQVCIAILVSGADGKSGDNQLLAIGLDGNLWDNGNHAWLITLREANAMEVEKTFWTLRLLTTPPLWTIILLGLNVSTLCHEIDSMFARQSFYSRYSYLIHLSTALSTSRNVDNGNLPKVHES